MSRHVEGPYPLFVFAALIPWTFFATAVTQASSSMLGSSNLVSKVYFPRLLIPIAAVLGGLVDFGIAFTLLLALMVVFDVSPTTNLLFVPFLVVGATVSAAGIGILLASLVVAYRDIRYVTGFLLQLWMFASPIVYPLDIVPERWRLVYALNPMVGVVSGFRSATLGAPFETTVILVSACAAVGLLGFGTRYFLRAQRRFADII